MAKGEHGMNIEEAKELLSYHSGTNEDVHNPKWEYGFLGSLRPFRGKLYEENFIEVMECLNVLKDEFSTPMIDKRMVSDIVGMVCFARVWASPEGMLGSNHLLTSEQTRKLLIWIDIIEESLMYLLDDAPEEAFWSYNEYLDGRIW